MTIEIKILSDKFQDQSIIFTEKFAETYFNKIRIVTFSKLVDNKKKYQDVSILYVCFPISTIFDSFLFKA